MQFMELLEMQKEGSKTYERRTSHTPDKTLPLNAAILLIPIDFKKLSFEKVVTSRIPLGNFLLHFRWYERTYIKTKNPLFHKNVMYLCVAIYCEQYKVTCIETPCEWEK